MPSPIERILSSLDRSGAKSAETAVTIPDSDLNESEKLVLEAGVPELVVTRGPIGYLLYLTEHGQAAAREATHIIHPKPSFAAYASRPAVEAADFSWLHLSDIHFGHGDKAWIANQKKMLDHLIEDCDSLVSKAGRLDAVFVTGDIAFSSGKRNLGGGEYAAAAKFIEGATKRLGVPITNWYFVPGNHDVAREASGDSTAAMALRKCRGKPPKKDVGTATPDDEDLPSPVHVLDVDALERLRERLKNYDAFVQSLGVADQPSKGWMRTVATLPSMRITAIGVNTALLANDEHDYGRLQGDPHGFELLRKARVADDEFRFVLGHHPFEGWMSSLTADDQNLEGFADVHLFGHIHKGATRSIRSGSGRAVLSIAAGAVHDERPLIVEVEHMKIAVPHAHGYSIGRLHVADRRVDVFPRKWSPAANWYRRDVDATPDEGPSASHDLRRSFSPTAPPARRRLARPPPVERLKDIDFGRFHGCTFLYLASLSGWGLLENNQELVRGALTAGGKVWVEMLDPQSKYFVKDGVHQHRINRQADILRVARELRRDCPRGSLVVSYLDAKLSYTLLVGGKLGSPESGPHPEFGVLLPHPAEAELELSYRMVGLNFRCDEDDVFWREFVAAELKDLLARPHRSPAP